MGRSVSGWICDSDWRVLAALWKMGVLDAIGSTWTTIGVVILIGLGIMFAVSNSGTKENIQIERK